VWIMCAALAVPPPPARPIAAPASRCFIPFTPTPV
jgi:hypothetical protein